MTTPHYIENSADAIRFVRDRPWYPLDESHVYEVPVSALETICMACWATLEDTRFAGNVIDDETLRGRYFELCNREDDEAVQKEWGRFSDDPGLCGRHGPGTSGHMVHRAERPHRH